MPRSGVEEGEALVRLVFAETLFATGEHEDIATRCSELASDSSARPDHSDPWRQSFLHRVPEHARTLALAAALDS